ncbi:MAG: dehydrogenase-like [Geobacteraceae bacterium]|nr:MAG: dehydrogenase-like [Geobacteraceae bacterium]
MFKVKIYGAGSIGNHLANASRRMGWAVDICDVDDAALERTRTQIYPGRYGKWDDSIRLYNVNDVPVNGYDLIIIGTPPEYHLDIAIKSLQETPKLILIEKPLCKPDLDKAQLLYELTNKSNTKICVGYDHVLGKATQEVEQIIKRGSLEQVETIDVEFREHWQGIFNAHAWLSGPQDTYLGFWKRGGGASGEHSHALNLWQHVAHAVGAGRVLKVSAMLEYVTKNGVDYDKLCALNLKTESGLVGRVVQDVVTIPPRKWGRIQSVGSSVEWQFGHKPGVDTVSFRDNSNNLSEYSFEKTRPDDFIIELTHLKNLIDGNVVVSSGISLERGLDTMLVLAAAHLSAKERRSVAIDYSRGYVAEALKLI